MNLTEIFVGEDELPVLAEAAVCSPRGPHLRDQLLRAGGNPLFVLELLAALMENATVVRTGGEVEIEQSAQPCRPVADDPAPAEFF